jgi:hypothetical protein
MSPMSKQPTGGPPDAPLSWAAAAARFLWMLPAWLLASAVVRLAELFGSGALDGRLAMTAAGFDIVDFLRWLPLLFLSAWPFLRRPKPWPLALMWSVLLLLQMGLSSYFLVARTPLGSDLFAYSLDDINTTLRGADLTISAGPVLVGLIALAVLWTGLRMAWNMPRHWGVRPVAGLLLFSLSAWLLPLRGAWLQGMDLDSQLRAQDKAGFFLTSVAQMWRAAPAAPTAPPMVAAAGGISQPTDPAAQGSPAANPDFPFMRTDRTQDVLGPYFSLARRPPTLVFVVVEGLGRDFSGPNSRLGSFTPFLDELAGRSLYFEHFIAPQGRTFGVLPSVFGSLPFGQHGFNDLGDKMPIHDDLFSTLQSNGYDTRFYSGTNLDFDNERTYLTRQGVKKLRDLAYHQREHVLPAGSNSWGFADADLVRFALAGEAKEADAPAIVALQTISMHTDYHFPDQERYRTRVLERVHELGIAQSRWQFYRDNIDIFSSILYTDDALRQFFKGVQSLPGQADTVYILTGDHRLPELPMSDVLERHHVPLLIYSPLLKAPANIRAVSSQFDLAPSLLAWLSHTYGLRTPTQTAWLGKGLDMFAEYRNLQDIPIKPVKGEPPAMLSGDQYLLRGQLYNVSPQLSAEATSNPQALATLQTKLAAFDAANRGMESSGRLLPPDTVGQLATWDTATRKADAVQVTNANAPAQLLVRDVKVEGLQVRATFVNTGGQPSNQFVPLLVITDAAGRDLAETSGPPLQLIGGDTRKVDLTLPANARESDRYLALFPADPNTGKRVGEGVFHRPLEPR